MTDTGDETVLVVAAQEIGINFTNVPANVSFRITVNGQPYGTVSDKLKHQEWTKDMGAEPRATPTGIKDAGA